jgi:hypothetical protein
MFWVWWGTDEADGKITKERVKGNVLGKLETKRQTCLDRDDDSMSPPWWKGDF